MTSSVYDRVGQPIKVGYLVAYAYFDDLVVERVSELSRKPVVLVIMESGLPARPENCVVLEEPVWPNTR